MKSTDITTIIEGLTSAIALQHQQLEIARQKEERMQRQMIDMEYQLLASGDVIKGKDSELASLPSLLKN